MGLLAPGAVVAGCRIQSVVGRGGMGVVYRALDLELGRVVALKLIAPELLENAGIRARFLKEARTAAAIEHPNVIPVYAAGERDGSAYLVMRYVDGDDLRALVRRDGPLAPGRAAELISRVGAGLDVIHRAGFVHRDVKPANVLVDHDGHVYVTDFGLAKAMLTRGGATATGEWVGTLDYVAPEQIRGGLLDARSDVYALGGVLHFMLTGHVPFERGGDEAKLWAQLSSPAPEPSRVRPGVPREFDGVVARAMAKQPDGRYPSAGDLGRAAVAAAAGSAPSQPERMVARGAAAPGGDTTVI
jgi:serine/threonine protein kinase